MEKEKEQALLFAYNETYANYKKMKRARKSQYFDKEFGLALYQKHLMALQGLMNKNHKMKIDFYEL